MTEVEKWSRDFKLIFAQRLDQLEEVLTQLKANK